jgi:hypothetical protein
VRSVGAEAGAGAEQEHNYNIKLIKKIIDKYINICI